MDVNTILTHLVQRNLCFPAMKLAWNCELELPGLYEIPKISPSHYVREIELNTDQRHSLLCQQQKKLEFWGPGFEFTVVPSIVVFQQYKGGENLTVNLSIRNISRQLQKIQILMDENETFSLEYKSTRIAKFASGMTISATIKFTPEDDKDYLHKLIIGTKNTRFAIPILGIGGRAVLNIPDKIDFGKVPVKYLKSQTLSVCNTGSKYARFTLHCDGSYCVSPEKGVVAPNDSFNLTISYYSDIIDVSDGYLCVKFENGEQIYTKLTAETVNEDIYIIPAQISFIDTYIGLKSKEKLTIINNSNITLHFTWKKYETKYGRSNSSAGSTMSIYKFIRRSIDGNLLPLPSPTLTDDDNFLPSELHIDPIQKPEPLFEDKYFVIEPLTGEIPPQSSTDIHILFTPKESRHFEISAFCDITGQEERIPLLMSGNGLGAKFRFGFDSLDTGEVYLGGGHTYEIPVTNISEIKGSIRYEGVASLVPRFNFKVEPRKIKLAPGNFSAFYVNFNCTGNPEEFFEKLKFRGVETDEEYAVAIKGSVNFPRLHFSTSILEFGEISYGFPKVEQIVLYNDTLNCVDINLRMDEDGFEPALTFEEIIASFEDEQIVLPTTPKEFIIDPTTFQLQPKGFQRISVMVLSNNYGEYRRKLLVCIGEGSDNNGEPVHSLPIFADCVAPALSNGRPDIHLQDLFVAFPYPDEFHILNMSNLPGIYCVIPIASKRITLESDHFVGLLKPKKVTSIPFTLMCNANGESKAEAELYLAGKADKVLDLEIKCSAFPCKLGTSVESLDFGSIPVLEFHTQTFEVINDSPLTIPFQTIVVEGGSVGDDWDITPQFGSIEPYGRHIIKVECKLRECGPHTSKIRVQMMEAATAAAEINVKAVGVGVSLDIRELDGVTPRDISIVDFGTLFTKTEEIISFDVTNLCFFPKVLEWKVASADPPENVKPKSRGPFRPVEPPSRFLGRKKDPAKKNKKSVFRVDPVSILLGPNETVTMHIKTSSEVSKIVDEEYILWSYTPQNLENSANKQLNKLSRKSIDAATLPVLIQAYKPVIARVVSFKAIFESPKLQFSKKSIIFKIDASPYDDNFEHKVSVKIDNPGTLPIPAIFQTEFPFAMFIKGSLGVINDRNNSTSTGSGENETNTIHHGPAGDKHNHNNNGSSGTTDWSYTFQPKASISMIINFDARHVRKDKGSLYFDSKLNVFVEGHPDSDSIQLRGEVHFPSVTCNKKFIDFGTIPNGAEAVDTFTLTNICNFCLTYKWYIRPNSTFIKQRPLLRSVSLYDDGTTTNTSTANKFSTLESTRDTTTGEHTYDEVDPIPPVPSFAESDVSLLLQNDGIHVHHDKEAREYTFNEISDDEEYRDFPKPSKSDEFGNSKSMTHLDLFGDSVQFMRDKIHRAKFMDIVGLQDPSDDTIDEVHYLQKLSPYREPKGTPNNDDSPFSTTKLNIAELIDITPLCGVIQAGQQQKFTVVFYGHTEIHFKTVLVCFLEGGTLKYLPITGRSTKPNMDMLLAPPGQKYDKRDSQLPMSVMGPLTPEQPRPSTIEPKVTAKSKKTRDQSKKRKDIKKGAKTKIPKPK